MRVALIESRSIISNIKILSCNIVTVSSSTGDLLIDSLVDCIDATINYKSSLNVETPETLKVSVSV